MLIRSIHYRDIFSGQVNLAYDKYLEYILFPSGLTMSDDKVKIVQNWPEPKKVEDIQFFLGFTNFYH